MCRFSSSPNGLHLALRKLGFKATIISKDGNAVDGQGENEPPRKWVGGAFPGFLDLASLAVQTVGANQAADAVASFSAQSLTPVTLVNSLSGAQYFSIYKEKIMEHYGGSEA